MEQLHGKIKSELNGLASFGLESSGGVSRLLYDENWVKAQNYLKEKFEHAGLVAYYDEVGNLFGRLEGENTNETILSGSHVDTVTQGGTLDGQLGIISGFIAIDYLKETYGKPKRNLEVISIAEEEGSRFPYTFWGAKNLVGSALKEDVETIADANGVSFEQAMRQAGFNYRTKPVRDDIKAFVELHIEQGKVLETEKKAIGVVTAISGQRRYTVKLKGEANHAGTTPMSYRHDAVHCFAKICVEATEKANQIGDPLVITFGKVEPKPNVVNVVSGEVLFTIDCRHTDAQALIDFTAQLEADMEATAKSMGLSIEIDRYMDAPPVPMDEKIIEMMENGIKAAGLDYKMMYSGAGHDAQIIADIAPVGMIFAPSIAGISHNPKEATHLEDLVEGVKALIASLYELGYK